MNTNCSCYYRMVGLRHHIFLLLGLVWLTTSAPAQAQPQKNAIEARAGERTAVIRAWR